MCSAAGRLAARGRRAWVRLLPARPYTGLVHGGAAAVLGLALLAPLLAAAGLGGAAGGVRDLLAGLCHQLPERSFHLAGEPLGICVRCTGLHAGVVAGCALLARGLAAHPLLRHPALFPACALLLFLDWWVGAGAAPSAPTLLSGVAFGVAAALGPHRWVLRRVYGRIGSAPPGEGRGAGTG